MQQGIIVEQGMAAERFRREARAAARIRGEHVCRVLDVGTLRGIPYMVMEFLEGRDLAMDRASAAVAKMQAMRRRGIGSAWNPGRGVAGCRFAVSLPSREPAA